MVKLFSSSDTVTAWIYSSFISAERSDFPMVDNLQLAVNASPMLTSLSAEEILLSKYIN